MQLISGTVMRVAPASLALDAHAIHVWLCDYPPAPPISSSALPDPAARLLGAVLARYPGYAGELMIERDRHGKPHLAAALAQGASSLHFNVSHSARHALVALALGQPVGIDLEQATRPRRAVLPLAQRFFCAGEIASLAALPQSEQTQAFLRLWTCKEAVLKALGRGIAFGLARLEFALDDKGQPLGLVSIAADGGALAGWRVRALAPGPGLLGALAWHGPQRAVECFDATLSV